MLFKNNMKDDKNLFDALYSDASQYEISEYWTDYSERICSAIRKYGVKKFHSKSELNVGFGDTCKIYSFAEYLQRKKLGFLSIFTHKLLPPIGNQLDILFSKMLWERQSASYSKHYPTIHKHLYFEQIRKNSLAHKPQKTIKVNGKPFGQKHLRSLGFLDSLEKHPETSSHLSTTSTVCEIGAGFGSFVDVIATCYPNIRKIFIIDIFPIIYISTQYLKFRFSEDNVADYVDFIEENEKFRNAKFVCLPAWACEKIVNQHIDFFWNASSFQEMSHEQVEAYIEFIKNNASLNALVGCYFYNSSHNSNSHKKSLSHLAQSLKELYRNDNPQTDIQGTISVLQALPTKNRQHCMETAFSSV